MRFSLAAFVLFFGFSVSQAQTVDPQATKAVTTAMAAIQKVFERKMPPKRSFALRAFARTFGERSEVDAMADKIEAKTNTSDCVFDLPIDQDPGQGDDQSGINLQSIHAEISGDKCPLVAALDFVVKSAEPKVDANFTLNYEARTPELQLEVGMKRAGLSGGLAGDLVKTPDGSARFDIHGEMDGLTETLDYGDVSQAITYGIKGALIQPPEGTMPNLDDLINIEMNEAQRYANAGKETRLRSSFTMKGLNMTAHYFVGETEVSAEEYKKYQSDLQLPGFQNPTEQPEPGPGPGPVPGPPGSAMMCVLQVFDASEVPLAKLQEYLSGGQGGLPGFPLQSMSGCSRSVSTSFPYKGQNVEMSLQFGPEFTVATVGVGSLSTPIYAQNDDNTAVAGQTGAVTHILVCNPVDQCH